MTRRFPWVLQPVAWPDQTEFTRGTWHGNRCCHTASPTRPCWPPGVGYAHKGYGPVARTPVAFLYFRCRKANKLVFANLYLIHAAKPVRPMTPARQSGKDTTVAEHIPPLAYPVPQPEDDPRFTFGLTLDVAAVLVAHGYPPIVAGDYVALRQALFAFLYDTETTDSTTGHTPLTGEEC